MFLDNFVIDHGLKIGFNNRRNSVWSETTYLEIEKTCVRVISCIH